ncbi:sigma 54-interacting transcriptional regulator [Bradyrhizobium valentinum]|nr:sigma 54-interacting transcriptional regulator [Bradyrhizobium valentinum]
MAEMATPFLDEIGEISPHFQKLLCLLQEQGLQRVGDKRLSRSPYCH